MVKTAVAAGYSAGGVSVKVRPQDRGNEWLALKPNTPRRVCELGEVRGDPHNGQQQRSRRSAITAHPSMVDALLAGLIRCKALRPQAHTPVLPA